MIGQQSASGIQVAKASALYEDKSAQSVIRWALDTYGGRAAVCTSFQAEGMVVLDMACQIDPGVRVFTIDTGRMPQETYDLIDAVRERYGIEISVNLPDQVELGQMLRRHGVNSFYRSSSLRLFCCEIRKVNPLGRALDGLDAWITGVRRSQSQDRAGAKKIELDDDHGGITKLSPLADWSYEQVWDYIKANDVPYNSLYDRGYTSIGCAPCTRPVQPGEDLRAGRWWWEDGVPKECGIHMYPSWGRA